MTDLNISSNIPWNWNYQATYPAYTPQVYYYYPQYIPAHSLHQCPATHRYTPSHSVTATGIQCKYSTGHDGDHAGYAGYGTGDVFWRDDEPEVTAVTGALRAHHGGA